MKEQNTTVVTVSRLMGSGGSLIGQRIAKRLGYQYVDREILHQAAEYLGAEEDSLAGREERLSGFWESFLRMFSLSTPEAGYTPPPLRPVYDRELLDTEAKIISEIAERQNAVIIGRGAAHILRGHPGLVTIFVHASIEFRLQRMMEAYDLTDREEARATIDDTDRERGRFVRSMFGGFMADARNYHLCIDTSATGFDAAEEMIVTLIHCLKHGSA